MARRFQTISPAAATTRRDRRGHSARANADAGTRPGSHLDASVGAHGDD